MDESLIVVASGIWPAAWLAGPSRRATAPQARTHTLILGVVGMQAWLIVSTAACAPPPMAAATEPLASRLGVERTLARCGWLDDAPRPPLGCYVTDAEDSVAMVMQFSDERSARDYFAGSNEDIVDRFCSKRGGRRAGILTVVSDGRSRRWDCQIAAWSPWQASGEEGAEAQGSELGRVFLDLFQRFLYALSK
jgi:hypothetical protein